MNPNARWCILLLAISLQAWYWCIVDAREQITSPELLSTPEKNDELKLGECTKEVRPNHPYGHKLSWNLDITWTCMVR